jgi:hypothetical protein
MVDEQRKPGVVEGGNGLGPVTYEAPRLRAVGNLRDLLAGTGSLPCDGTDIATGPDPASGPIGTPTQCPPG